jgi:uncharacterized protein (TIGR00369 family)
MFDRVRASFDRQGLMSTIGAAVKEVSLGNVCLELPYSERVTQQHGFFHGGGVASLADTAAGYAAYTTMDQDQQPLTVEFKISLLAPAQGQSVEARGRVIKAGRRLRFVQAEVFAIEAGSETLVAIALATVTASRSVKETS